jgi:hypothetical protein
MFRGFMGGKTPTTLQTFPPATDGIAFGAGSGIDDLAIKKSAVGAEHGDDPAI